MSWNKKAWLIWKCEKHKRTIMPFQEYDEFWRMKKWTKGACMFCMIEEQYGDGIELGFLLATFTEPSWFEQQINKSWKGGKLVVPFDKKD